MINQNYEAAASNFCGFYPQYMMCNYQNTSDLQAVTGEALFANDFQNSGANLAVISGPGANNTFSSFDSHNAKVDKFQSQMDYYQGFMPTQDSYIKV